MKNIIIYCDGACSGNPGPGGWAAIIKNESNEDYQLVNGSDQTTNNQMELASAIGPLEFLANSLGLPDELKNKYQIIIYSDSEYLIKGMNEWLKNWKFKGWKTANKKPVSNKDLWLRLDEYNQLFNITWIWTKGHANCEENNKVDELAYNEAQRRKNILSNR